MLLKRRKIMQTEKVRFLTEKFNKQLSANDAFALNKKLSAAKDEAFAPLNALTVKSKLAATLLSVFLGGVCAGRFYVGDYVYAIVKIVVTIAIGLISGLLSFVPVLGILISVASSIGLVIWYIYEIVKCNNRAQEVNYTKICEVLTAYSV